LHFFVFLGGNGMRALLAIVFSIFASATFAQSFDESTARSACEAVTVQEMARSAEKWDAVKRNVVVNFCMGLERNAAAQVARKRLILPQPMYASCAAANRQSFQNLDVCLDNVLRALPLGSVRGIWHLGGDLFWSSEDCNAAREERRDLGTCAPYPPEPTPEPPSAYTRGKAALAQGDFDRAIAEFTTAIADDPKNPFSYIRRGTAYEQKGDAASAIGDYRKVLKLVDADSGAEYAAKIRKLEKTNH
jgi:tetratricopeptide (TPR) repeat protein